MLSPFITKRFIEIYFEVEQWLHIQIASTIKISNIEKNMGTGNLNNIVDKTIIATKKVIYRNRQQGKSYCTNKVLSILKSQMLIEESGLEGNDERFLKRGN